MISFLNVLDKYFLGFQVGALLTFCHIIISRKRKEWIVRIPEKKNNTEVNQWVLGLFGELVAKWRPVVIVNCLLCIRGHPD